MSTIGGFRVSHEVIKWCTMSLSAGKHEKSDLSGNWKLQKQHETLRSSQQKTQLRFFASAPFWSTELVAFFLAPNAVCTSSANINFIISARWVFVDVDGGNDLCHPNFDSHSRPRTARPPLPRRRMQNYSFASVFLWSIARIVKQADFVKYLWYFSAHDSIFTYAEHQHSVFLSFLHLAPARPPQKLW